MFSDRDAKFSTRVSNFLNAQGGATSVPNFKHTKQYRVRLSADGTEIELLDRPHLVPIPLAAFDKIEDCLSLGIHTPGCAKSRLGDVDLDNQTIMYHVGRDIYGKNDGDSILCNSCYILAILDASGCIDRQRGNISKCPDSGI